MIKDALELIRDPNKWTRGSYARDKNDVIVELRDVSATKYCVRGVADCSVEDYTRAELVSARSLISVNDRLGHEAVESCL